MTAEERIAQLEQENAQLRAELAEAHQQIAQLAERLQQVEGRLAKDSHNSSKAPSSDGPARPSRSQRKASGKKTGGQAGHAGRTLMQAASPDEVLLHRPGRCAHCQQSLQGVPGQIKECRQVHDLPQLRLLVQEHQVEEVRCPHCQQLTRADFPAGVEAPVQYGPNVRALAVSSLVKSSLPLYLKVSRSCTSQVVSVIELSPSGERKWKRYLKGGQGLQRRQFTHQLCFRDTLSWQSNGLFASFGLTNQGLGVRIKANGHAAPGKVLPEIVLIAS